MAPKVIVSYDGTDLDRDALALARLLGRAGATHALAYVRHFTEARGREQLAEHEAEELLAGGAAWLGDPGVPRFVVHSASTPQGLRELALKEGADVIVFGSAYRTTPGHVYPQASAERLLEGGPIAIGIAPAGYADRTDGAISSVAAVDEDGDTSAAETAAALASRLSAVVEERPSPGAGFLVVGSKAATRGTVLVSAASAYLVELSRCPVLVVPRGVPLAF